MKVLWILALAVILTAGIFSLAGCREIGSPLEDFNWVLIRYGEPGSYKTPLPDTEITAFFNSEDKRVTGSGGCNGYGGTYEVDGLDLKITELAQTLISCGDEKDAQEKEFMDALRNAGRFEMDQGNLIIYSGQTRLVFRNTNSTVPPPSFWGD